jgi:hypothetical protein
VGATTTARIIATSIARLGQPAERNEGILIR